MSLKTTIVLACLLVATATASADTVICPATINCPSTLGSGCTFSDPSNAFQIAGDTPYTLTLTGNIRLNSVHSEYLHRNKMVCNYDNGVLLDTIQNSTGDVPSRSNFWQYQNVGKDQMKCEALPGVPVPPAQCPLVLV